MSEKNKQTINEADFINGQGESINDYIERTGGSIDDYSRALGRYRQDLATERGVDIGDLHTGKVEAVRPMAGVLIEISLGQLLEETN